MLKVKCLVREKERIESQKGGGKGEEEEEKGEEGFDSL